MDEEDLTGRIFGKLTVIKKDGKKPYGGSSWECLCECGEKTFVSGYSLRRKNGTRSCGNIIHSLSYLNLIGKKIGKLTVIEEAPKRGHSRRWVCRCSCGNIVTVNTSVVQKNENANCGCSRREDAILRNVGKKFGKVTITGISEDYSPKNQKWKCLCSCGGVFETQICKLKSGHTQSCGCYQKERTVVEIIGEKYGISTVIKRHGSDKFMNATWLCQCSCGKQFIAAGSSLRFGSILSCGCLKSKGEKIISDILSSYAIAFQREKKFLGCIKKGPLRFDFFLPNNGMCIEFDGPQHYKQNRWNDKNKLELTKNHDAIKTKYCEENDIVLLRIPYTKISNIKSILEEWGIIDSNESIEKILDAA